MTEFRRAKTLYSISVPTSVPNEVLDLWRGYCDAAGVEVQYSGFTPNGCYLRVRLDTDDENAVRFARDILCANGFTIKYGTGLNQETVYRDDWADRSRNVLADVLAERCSQEVRYGHLNGCLENGTGPEVAWLNSGDRVLNNRTAAGIQISLRAEYEKYEAETGTVDWMRLVREEIAEAFQESDPKRLEEELIQVAALCVSWIERLRTNR